MEYNGVKYEAIMSRSFFRQERKTMEWCAILGFFIISFTLCIFLKPYSNNVGPPALNAQVPMANSPNLQGTKDNNINNAPPLHSKMNETKPVCDLKRPRSDICDANGDIRVIGNSSTIFVVSTARKNMSWNIRPYARKGDEIAMGNVRNLTIKELHHSHRQIRGCTRKFNVPAVVFSSGGYAGNVFHVFTDLLIPLYLTSREFDGEVQFVVTDVNKVSGWINKFKEVLQRLSKYEIIDLDQEKDGYVLCFPRMIIGLKANKEFSIDVAASKQDQIPPYSTKNFTEFLRSAYDLKRDVAVNLSRSSGAKKLQPRLLIISRNHTRRFLNAGEVSAMAGELGFDVVVQETGGNVSEVSKFVNDFDVLVGVHGAGLSNMVFLPGNAVVVQVVGLGMNWIAWNDYELPAFDMGLRYLGYKIGVNESSLAEQYPIGHEVLRNPGGIRFKGWKPFREVYLDRQDVKLDVNRFRGTLLKAIELLRT